MSSVGYMRVSTEEQNHDLQYDALIASGVKPKNIYKDIISGTTTSRDGLDTAIGELKEGDTLVVWKLDRLGRKAIHLYTLVDGLQTRGIAFKSITEGFDTSKPMGKAMFGMICVFAEMERDTIAERTRAGMAAAKARGVRIGRPPRVPYDRDAVIKLLKEGKSCRDIEALIGISKSTVARISATLKEK